MFLVSVLYIYNGLRFAKPMRLCCTFVIKTLYAPVNFSQHYRAAVRKRCLCAYLCACRGGGEHHRSQVASGVNHLANIMYNIHTKYSTTNVSDRVPRVLWIHCETSSSGMHIYSPAAKISAALYGYTRVCILFITRATENMPDHGRFVKSYDEHVSDKEIELSDFCHSFETYRLRNTLLKYITHILCENLLIFWTDFVVNTQKFIYCLKNRNRYIDCIKKILQILT